MMKKNIMKFNEFTANKAKDVTENVDLEDTTVTEGTVEDEEDTDTDEEIEESSNKCENCGCDCDNCDCK